MPGVSGVFALAVVRAGGRMRALAAGGPSVFLWWWSPCLVCLWVLVGTGVSW